MINMIRNHRKGRQQQKQQQLQQRQQLLEQQDQHQFIDGHEQAQSGGAAFINHNREASLRSIGSTRSMPSLTSMYTTPSDVVDSTSRTTLSQRSLATIPSYLTEDENDVKIDDGDDDIDDENSEVLVPLNDTSEHHHREGGGATTGSSCSAVQEEEANVKDCLCPIMDTYYTPRNDSFFTKKESRWSSSSCSTTPATPTSTSGSPSSAISRKSGVLLSGSNSGLSGYGSSDNDSKSSKKRRVSRTTSFDTAPCIAPRYPSLEDETFPTSELLLDDDGNDNDSPTDNVASDDVATATASPDAATIILVVDDPMETNEDKVVMESGGGSKSVNDSSSSNKSNQEQVLMKVDRTPCIEPQHPTREAEEEEEKREQLPTESQPPQTNNLLLVAGANEAIEYIIRSGAAQTHSEARTLLHDLSQKFKENVSVQHRRYRLRLYKSCFVAEEAVSWLIQAGYAFTRRGAVQLGRALQRANLFEHVCGDHAFRDGYYFFRFITINTTNNNNKYNSTNNTNNDPNAESVVVRSPPSEDVVEAFKAGIDIKDRKYHLKTYKQCFVGCDAVTWFVEHGYATSRKDAVKLGKALQRSNVLDHVCGDHEFTDNYYFYRFLKPNETLSDQHDTSSDDDDVDHQRDRRQHHHHRPGQRRTKVRQTAQRRKLQRVSNQLKDDSMFDAVDSTRDRKKRADKNKRKTKKQQYKNSNSVDRLIPKRRNGHNDGQDSHDGSGEFNFPFTLEITFKTKSSVPTPSRQQVSAVQDALDCPPSIIHRTPSVTGSDRGEDEDDEHSVPLKTSTTSTFRRAERRTSKRSIDTPPSLVLRSTSPERRTEDVDDCSNDKHNDDIVVVKGTDNGNLQTAGEATIEYKEYQRPSAYNEDDDKEDKYDRQIFNLNIVLTSSYDQGDDNDDAASQVSSISSCNGHTSADECHVKYDHNKDQQRGWMRARPWCDVSSITSDSSWD